MSASQQRKGRAGELELVRLLQAKGIPARPGDPVSYGHTPDVTGVPGVHVEVKRVERLDLHKAMTQAVQDAERFRDGAPAVFHRRNRGQWMVTMLLSDWLNLYERGCGHEYKRGDQIPFA